MFLYVTPTPCSLRMSHELTGLIRLVFGATGLRVAVGVYLGCTGICVSPGRMGQCRGPQLLALSSMAAALTNAAH